MAPFGEQTLTWPHPCWPRTLREGVGGGRTLWRGILLLFSHRKPTSVSESHSSFSTLAFLPGNTL